MANIRLNAIGNRGIDLGDFDIRELGNYDFWAVGARSAKFYDGSQDYTLFAGTGFKFKSVQGELRDVTGGTITRLDVVMDGVKVLATSGKFSAVKIFDFYVAGDIDGALNYMLSGNDRLTGTRFSDVLFAAEGRDTVRGGGGHDALMGEAGNDILRGDAGSDMLIGGDGRDVLFGGRGADTFVFTSIGDSTIGARGRDTIEDFSRRQNDMIDLGDIDADATARGDQDFDFIGSSAFTREAGELRYHKRGGDTFLFGDVNGDGRADFSIHVDARIDFVERDFLL